MSDTATIAMPASLVERLTGVLERLEGRLASDPAVPPAGLLTIEQVAKRLQKSPRDVQRLVRAGKLKKVPNLGSRTTRFRPADVDRFTEDKENRPGGRRL